MRETSPRCLRMQEIECLRDAAAHHDRLRAVEVRKIAEADAEPGRLASEQRQREAVALRAAATMSRAVMASARMRPRQQARRLGSHGLAAGACERAARGERLEAAMRAAGAERPVRRDDHVADMAGHAAAAMQQTAVDHDAAADAGADRHIDEMAEAPGAAEFPLAIGGRDPVILDDDGQAEFSASVAASGNSSQPGRVGMAMIVPVSLSSGPGADTPTPAISAAASADADLVAQLPDLLDDLLRPAGDVGRDRRRG